MNACEDLSLNQFVKKALESQAPITFHHQQPSRSWLKWSASALLAASLSVLALPWATILVSSNSVVDTIGLLSDAEGRVLVENELASPVELLLAWQDRPYQDCMD